MSDSTQKLDQTGSPTTNPAAGGMGDPSNVEPTDEADPTTTGEKPVTDPSSGTTIGDQGATGQVKPDELPENVKLHPVLQQQQINSGASVAAPDDKARPQDKPEEGRPQPERAELESPEPEGVLAQIRHLIKEGRGGHSSPEVITAEDLEDFRKRAREGNVSEDVAEELALALGVAQRIRTQNTSIKDATERLRFVFDCLLAEPPRLTLARDERLRLQFDIYKRAGLLSRFLAWISAGSSVSLVLAALLTSLACWTIGVLVVHWLVKAQFSTLPGNIFFMEGRALTVVASAAFIGGVVSIATRLREFARVRDLDPFAMFWTATLKPLIGVVLSFFLLATLAGDIISFSFLGDNPLGFGQDGNLPNNLPAGSSPVREKTLYILWMLAFLTGFSERFAYDFVDRAQGMANGGAKTDKRTG